VIGQKLMSTPHNARQARNSLLIAGACGAFAAGMVGAAYAAVPLYSWFCRTTGFAGTPQVATSPPDHVVARKLKIRFDANVAGGLPWRFEPEENSVSVKVGEVVSVNYRVINQSARDTVPPNPRKLSAAYDNRI
jgi:cytochrome c oxidase assembly protein subunit 11